MSEKAQLNFVIVGHVDHGKSTLIGRLLFDTGSVPSDRIGEIRKASEYLGKEIEFAYLLDHLEEERQQGVTIDTTQAFFKTAKRNYVIIDAPGHIEFVKNMITGASQADAAVLIVDAGEGVREQTKRHAYILSLLGIRQIIVVLNKMDLVDYKEERFNEIKKGIGEFLDSVNIDPHSYIPICATTGDNIARKSEKMIWFQGPNLLDSLDLFEEKEPAENKSLIFPVQDIYKVDNKRIAVGRVEAGVLNCGGEIKILPGGQITKINSIEKYLDKIDIAKAGQSIGITTENAVFLNRGDIICTPDQEPILTDKFKANIIWLEEQKYHKDQILSIKCATQETTCKIKQIKKRIDSSSLELIQKDSDILKNLEAGEVVIKTKKPVVIKSFNEVQELGRFVLVKDDNICAGGIITGGDRD